MLVCFTLLKRNQLNKCQTINPFKNINKKEIPRHNSPFSDSIVILNNQFSEGLAGQLRARTYCQWDSLAWNKGWRIDALWQMVSMWNSPSLQWCRNLTSQNNLCGAPITLCKPSQPGKSWKPLWSWGIPPCHLDEWTRETENQRQGNVNHYIYTENI